MFSGNAASHYSRFKICVARGTSKPDLDLLLWFFEYIKILNKFMHVVFCACRYFFNRIVIDGPSWSTWPGRFLGKLWDPCACCVCTWKLKKNRRVGMSNAHRCLRSAMEVESFVSHILHIFSFLKYFLIFIFGLVKNFSRFGNYELLNWENTRLFQQYQIKIFYKYNWQRFKNVYSELVFAKRNAIIISNSLWYFIM